MTIETDKRALAISFVIHEPEPDLFLNTIRTLAKALECAASKLGRVEVIVVDHSRARQGQDWLRDLREVLGPRNRLRYDFVGANKGFGAGHNRAFERCKDWAAYFLVANPDVEFDAQSLLAGITFLETHKAVGLLAPALVEDEGTLRPSCFRYPTLSTLLLRLLGTTARHPKIAYYECRDWDPTQPTPNPTLISGCCMLFRAEAYAALGGFDERYFLYFEDFDLALRASEAGLSFYLPTMRVRHRGGGAARKGWRHRGIFCSSAFRFFSAHGWRL